MKPAGKLWYTINDLMKRWGRSKKDIERYLKTGALEAITRIGIVDPNDSDTVHGQRANYISFFIKTKGLPGSQKFPPGTQLIITPAEVERFESENLMTITSIGNEAPYLDSDHEYYAVELAIAVKAWLAMYGDSGKYNPKKSHKSQIEKLLIESGVVSKAEVERIAIVVNPNKGGGPPPTGS